MNQPWSLHLEGQGPLDTNIERAIETFVTDLRTKGHEVKVGTFNKIDETKDLGRIYAGTNAR